MKLTKLYLAQDELNKYYSGEDWANSIPRVRMKFAIIGELFEFMNGWDTWEWWRNKPQVSKTQAELEIIDALHFALGYDLQSFLPARLYNVNTQYQGFIEQTVDIFEDKSVWEAVDYIIDLLQDDEVYAAPAVIALGIKYLEMTYEDIVITYLSKYALNVHRVKNGYREGKYIKIWQDDRGAGHEDNHFLEGFMMKNREYFRTNLDHITSDVGAFLDARYSQVLGSLKSQ